MRTRHRVTLLCIASLGLASAGVCMVGCDAAKKAMATNADPAKLFGNWTLINLEGKDTASLLPGGAKVPTLSVAADGTVGGFSGVNTFSSRVDPAKLAAGGFSLEKIASTLMAGPPESMKVESRFLATLQQVAGFKIDGDTLDLTKGADTLMKFVRDGT